jgi:hypothetical protein
MTSPGARILKAREELGKESTELLIARLEKTSMRKLEAEAKRLENEVKNQRSAWGHDARRMLVRLFAIRERMGEPVGPVEREALFSVPKEIVKDRLRVEERRLREHLDAQGVPVASWRIKRGMVASEVVAANGVMPERQGADA